jgi:hypothetical protein
MELLPSRRLRQRFSIGGFDVSSEIDSDTLAS